MLKGIAVSEGIGVGKVLLYKEERPKLDLSSIKEEEVNKEIARFRGAIEDCKEKIDKIGESAIKKVGAEEAKIFQAHLLILEDPALIKEVENKIKKKVRAEMALVSTVDKLVETFEALEDKYFKARALDIKDVGERILNTLLGKDTLNLTNLKRETIIVAADLKPSQVIQLDREKVEGIATDSGGATSHSAIIARSLQIPAVVGLKNITQRVKSQERLILDGGEGLVIVNPDSSELNSYLKLKSKMKEEEKILLQIKDLPAETKDGYRVKLLGNIGRVEEASSALSAGAEGIGLFRSEFLFLGKEAPSEEEQFKAYKRVAGDLKSFPVIIRTLDVGGDKEIPYLNLPSELNPNLGRRGIRLCLEEKELFKTQIRAILRANTYGNLKIMLPMVSTLEEVEVAKEIIEEVRVKLKAENIPLGIMIEVPSAALIADRLAPEVNFFSIGSNDLIQYTLACDRENEKVSNLYQALHPSVLYLIKKTVESAHQHKIKVGMCGEMAGDKLALPILLGLGLDELSMNISSLLNIKKLIRSLEYKEAKELANKVLKLKSQREVLENICRDDPTGRLYCGV